MIFKMPFFFLFLFSSNYAHSGCNANKLIQAGKKMPSSLKECSPLAAFWWNENTTSLHLAVLENDIKVAQTLLEKGVDVNIRNNYGETPLFHATEFLYIKMIELLIKYNANLLARDNEGATSLNRLMQLTTNSFRQDNPVIPLFLKTLGFQNDNTCENSDYALMAKDGSILIFKKKNGTIARYTPTLYGTDGFGNDKIQMLAEDHIYPNTIRIVLDLEWNHENNSIQGNWILNDFFLENGSIDEIKVEVTNLKCSWRKWIKFLSTIENLL